MQAKEKQIPSMRVCDMTGGDPMRHILRFALPLFIGTVFQQFYSFADTMIAGRNLGDAAIAAIGASGAVYSLLISFANGLNSGYGLVLSRLFGGQKREEFRKAAAAMLLLDAGITVFLTLLALLFLRPLLRWLQTPAEIFDPAYSYIAIILGGMLTTVFYNMCAGFLRSVGNSRTPLYFLVLSCGINLSLDALFIIVLKWGVAGAAAATVISQGVSALCCGAYIWRNYGELLPRRSDLILDRELTAELLTTGFSMALMLSVFSLGSIILQRSINRLSTQIITAHTVSRRIYELLMMPLSMLATANSTFVSQNYGAGQIDRIREALKKVLLAELIWSLASLGISLAGGRFLVTLLTKTADEAMIQNALLNLRLSTSFFFPLGALLVLRTAMQSMNYKIVPVLSSSIELAMKVLACAFLIPSMGYTGVAVTEPAIWVVCALFLSAVFVVRNVSIRTAQPRYD